MSRKFLIFTKRVPVSFFLSFLFFFTRGFQTSGERTTGFAYLVFCVLSRPEAFNECNTISSLRQRIRNQLNNFICSPGRGRSVRGDENKGSVGEMEKEERGSGRKAVERN